MKVKVYVLITALMLFSATNSQAAFYIKKHAQPTTTETTTNTATTPVAEPAADAPATTAPAAQPVHVKKQSFFSRMWHGITAKHSAAIPQILYIILAIIPLGGGLAMGLNDDFNGIDWVVCLLLYFVFYFPGLIYALIKMGKYY